MANQGKSNHPRRRERNLYRRGRWWWCDVSITTPDGRSQRRRFSLHTEDKEEAQRRLRLHLDRASQARHGLVEDVLWEEAVEQFRREVIQHLDSDISPGGAVRFNSSFHVLHPLLAGKLVRDIGDPEIGRVVSARLSAGRARSTVQNDLVAISRVLRFAKTKGWVGTDIMRTYDRTFVARATKKIVVPTDAEIAEVLAAAKAWNRHYWLLMMWLRNTGMRAGEALALHAEDISQDRSEARVWRAVKGNAVSGERERIVRLGAAANLLPMLRPTGRLFARLPARSSTIATIWRKWLVSRQAAENRAARVQRRAARPLPQFHAHLMRHAYAIAVLEADPNRLDWLQVQLGHASRAMTEKYLRGRPDLRRRIEAARIRSLHADPPLNAALAT